jgi:hypothetical protein
MAKIPRKRVIWNQKMTRDCLFVFVCTPLGITRAGAQEDAQSLVAHFRTR